MTTHCVKRSTVLFLAGMIQLRPTLRWMAALLLVAVAACRRGDSYNGRTSDRLIAVADGVVRDQRTGLQWTSRDHEEALNWTDADQYCRGLVLGQLRDWRLPEIEELRALYDVSFKEPCGDRTCHLDPAIHLTDPYVWSSTAPGVGARFYLDFAFGNALSPGIGPRLVRRVLCMRQPR